MDRGLMQREVAERIGVDLTTYRNWERNHTSPRTRYLPAVIRFLGYTPYEPPESFGDWLRMVRRSAGLTQKQLAARIGVDPSTVRGWEAGLHKAGEGSFRKIDRLGLTRPKTM
jgi:transcriptional regulator with XRE-family HTH domain